MLTISDNVATDELIEVIGLDQVNAAGRRLGMVRTELTSNVRDMLEAGSAALDPARGTRTTAAETVMLLQAIWTDRAGPPQACAGVRDAITGQLTRARIASGFAPPVRVAAKSGGLLGVVRNEAGVVTFPDGGAYAVAVFTRRQAGATADPALIDAGIGKIARTLVDSLRSSNPREPDQGRRRR
jgi:beta-lactamase class A